MSKTKFSLYEYDLPLTAPLRLKGGTLQSRTGMIVVGENENGNQAFGEIAPLPYFSTETFPIAREEAVTIAKSINGEKVHAIDSLQRAARSVAFGFDSILEKLNYNRPMPLVSEVCINALLTGEQSHVLSQALAKKGAGFRSFKLKIGSLPIEDTITLVRELRQSLGPECGVRLDANRSLSAEQTILLTDELADANIEYFEEPVKNVDELNVLLKNAASARIALDESLLDAANDFLLESPQVAALVVKPTILGPFRTRHLIEQARIIKKKIVISSSFESPIGITQLARLAASVKSNTPCGLDTLSVFADNLFGCYDWIENGMIKIDNLPESFDLSQAHFRKIV